MIHKLTRMQKVIIVIAICITPLKYWPFLIGAVILYCLLENGAGTEKQRIKEEHNKKDQVQETELLKEVVKKIDTALQKAGEKGTWFFCTRIVTNELLSGIPVKIIIRNDNGNEKTSWHWAEVKLLNDGSIFLASTEKSGQNQEITPKAEISPMLREATLFGSLNENKEKEPWLSEELRMQIAFGWYNSHKELLREKIAEAKEDGYAEFLASVEEFMLPSAQCWQNICDLISDDGQGNVSVGDTGLIFTWNN